MSSKVGKRCLRRKLKRHDTDKAFNMQCPVCTISLRSEKEFANHYNHELEMSSKEAFCNNVKAKRIKINSKSNAATNCQAIEPPDIGEQLNDIKKRKYERYAELYSMTMSKVRTSKNERSENNEHCEYEANSKDDSTYDLFSCAVCSKFLDGSMESTSKHLKKCFAKNDYEFNVYSSDEEEEEVEEFSWAGQTWIRTSSLRDGDFLRKEGRLMHLEMEDCDYDVVVDGDEDVFGKEQFTESDIIPCKSQVSQPQNNVSDENFSNFEQLEEKAGGNKDKLIDLLKESLVGLHQHLNNTMVKCSICMGPYTNPVVSTGCWHVCCMQCWLCALGAKKMCPKCNSIVSPSQLRKLFT